MLPWLVYFAVNCICWPWAVNVTTSRHYRQETRFASPRPGLGDLSDSTRLQPEMADLVTRVVPFGPYTGNWPL
jgi:hypothetical protein